MTTTIELIGTCLGTGVVATVANALVSWRKTGADRAKDQDTLAQAFAATLIAERKSLATELHEEREATDAAREEHASCRKLVGECIGRIEDQEVRLNRAEVALDDCKKQHETSTSDAKRLREQVRVLERRTSDPSTPRSA